MSTETHTNAQTEDSASFVDWLDDQPWAVEVEDDEVLVAVTIPRGNCLGFAQRDEALERGWVPFGIFPREAETLVVFEPIPEEPDGDTETEFTE